MAEVLHMSLEKHMSLELAGCFLLVAVLLRMSPEPLTSLVPAGHTHVFSDHKGIKLDVLTDQRRLDDFNPRMLGVLHNKSRMLDVLATPCCGGALDWCGEESAYRQKNA